MEFLSLKPEAFGLDISDLSLKIIKLKKGGGKIKLTSFGEFEIEKGIIETGEIKNVEKLAEILKKAKTKTSGQKLKEKEVICSLPEEKAFLAIIQLPKMEEEEVKKAAFFEAQNYIPLPLEDVYLDSKIIPPLYNSLDHLDVLIVALPKKIIDPYVKALKKAGFYPRVLEVESFAIARAVIKGGISSKPVLIIDFGATRTSFIVFSGKTVRFTSSIPISSQLFTEAISKALEIEPEKAEILKRVYGLSKPGEMKMKAVKTNGFLFQKEAGYGKRIFDALIPAVIDLGEQIRTCLDYYQSHASHEHLAPDHSVVEKVLLSGGGVNLPGLADFLEDFLKIPVKIANPWVNVLPAPLKGFPQLPPEESLKYTTAIGLALRGINEKAYD